MKINYTELNQQISNDLMGVRVAQSSKGCSMLVQESSFAQVPQGARVKSKSVSFSKLLPGDYVLVSAGDKVEVKRFVSIDVSRDTTRLVVTNSAKEIVKVAFTRLVGKVEKVRLGEENLDPNPSNFFQRTAFKLWQRFGSTPK